MEPFKEHFSPAYVDRLRLRVAECLPSADSTVFTGITAPLLNSMELKDRVKLLAESAEGFIYALSRTGVTGAHGVPSEGIGEQVAKIKAHTATPVCVGFGITTPDQALMVAKAADGVIVGSAIVKQIELHPGRAAEAVRDFTAPLIAATKSA